MTTSNTPKAKLLATWCGGSTGNDSCDYSCKACLIFSAKAELIRADDKALTLTYQIKEK